MASSFGNNANAGVAEQSNGPDLETIQTEALGFQSIAGDAKVRLTSSWTSLPSATSSLLSIASRKGLVAAAGPDQVILALTESVRKGFEAPKDGDSDIRAFEPQLKIPMSMRISQLSFTADESSLILSAEEGGGLAVYDVQSALQGSTSSSFELPTNGESLRALAPNPTPEKAELCAVITNNGALHVANLKDRKISDPLKNQVSCISWSSRGKQLCAGMADGSICQLTPEGEEKAIIPKPSGVGDSHVSSLTWLENHLFLAIYTSTSESPPMSAYYLITRTPPSSFTYQKLTDPVDPFGSDKIPHHSILRLRDFPPNLQDLLLVSSTASTEIGLLSRSKTPLTTEKSAELISERFTTTELSDDTRRPTLPMTDSYDDSTPIGLALDLSSKDKVYKPIPSDEELEESSGPLPSLWVLTHDGILCAWWVVYSDSVRQGTTYPGLLGETPPVQTANSLQASSGSPFGNPATTTSSASPFGSTAQSGQLGSHFGSKGSVFGSQSSAAPAFGSSSALGQKSSPWGESGSNSNPNTGGAAFGSSTFGSTAASSSPSFGKPSALGFGQSSQLGTKSSPWASAGGTGETFGQSGFANANNGGAANSPFGASAPAESGATTSGGFAGFASQQGFGAVANNNASRTSVFGSGTKATISPFGGTGTKPDTFFPSPNQDKSIDGSGNTFGTFKLQSSFKPDPSAQNGQQASPSNMSFGGAFGSALKDADQTPMKPTATEAQGTTPTTSPSKDQDMDTTSAETVTPQPKAPGLFATANQGQSTTPTSSPGTSAFDPRSPGTGSVFGQPSKLSSSGSLFSPKSDNLGPTGGIFGSKLEVPVTTRGIFGTKPSGTDASSFGFGTQPNKPLLTGGIFGNDPTRGGSTEITPRSSIFGQKTDASQSSEPGTSSSTTPKVEPRIVNDDAPLPPDTTSKIAYPLGESSSSSAASTAASQKNGARTTPAKPEAAPLPPDFTASSTPKPTKAADDAPLPPDFTKAPQKPIDDAPLPPDFTSSATKSPENKGVAEAAPLPPDPVKQTRSIFDSPASATSSTPNPFLKLPAAPSEESESDESELDDEDDDEEPEEEDGNEEQEEVEQEDTEEEEQEEEEEEEEEEDDDTKEDNATEGSGIDVAKDFSPTASGFSYTTPAFTPQNSFGGVSSYTPATAKPQTDQPKPLFGELSRNAPIFPKPTENSPRSPSPVRGAIPNRVLRSDAIRSVSAPGMASTLLGPKSHLGNSIVSTERPFQAGHDFVQQQRKIKELKETAESQPLIDDEDDDVQKILASEVEGTLELDEFIAHSNVAPPAKDSIPAQVEAVYRDINSMIDTLGLNARSLKAFTKGHVENEPSQGRIQEELEDANSWVLCEIDSLGDILEKELRPELVSSRVRDIDEKVDALNELARDMHRVRAKQDDLRRMMMIRMDPDQVERGRSLPLSAEQATQQNELRREYARFTKLLAEAEEALTLLRTKMASLSGPLGQGNSNVPTVEAVMRTITKMTSMAEKRSGDIDVLEKQLRKVKLNTSSREGSPVMTPQGRRSAMFSPDGTPSRGFRHSLSSSISFPAGLKATPPRKKLSGFSKEEKGELMEKRARKKAVLEKLKTSVERKGVSVWNIQDDIE